MINIQQEILVYIVAVLIVLSVILIFFLIRTEIRFKRLSRGNGKFNLEDSIKSIEEDLIEIEKFKMDMEKYLITLEKRVKKSIQGVSNINFKAFEGLDSGGNQSFALVFLNENGDGIILSTLHARDRVNVFSKKISNFKCDLLLTEEEQKALTQAKESCKL
jgi:hypothetical protein